MENGVDVVITWVDGSDPIHREKRARFSKNVDKKRIEYAASDSRYANNGELYLCIASILLYAKFIRKIWIVTDSQYPKARDYFVKNGYCSDSYITIVDHKSLFAGSEFALPTFNSLSIETKLFQIPGLSENYIYFNDDVFLNRPTTIDEWFKGGVPRIKSTLRNMRAEKVLLKQKKLKYRMMPRLLPRRYSYPDYYIDQEFGAILAGQEKYFWRHTHVPHPMRKSTLQNFYEEHKEVMESNIAPKFRERGQHSAVSLSNHLEINQSKIVPEPDSSCLYHNFSRTLFGPHLGLHVSLGTFRSVCAQEYHDINYKSRELFVEVMSNKFSAIFPQRELDGFLGSARI